MPSIDDILRDPASAASLSQAEVTRLLRECGAAVVILSAVEPTPVTSNAGLALVKPSDRLLTVEQAARILHKSTRWFYRNRHRLPWMNPAGTRSYLVDEGAMRDWLAAQRASAPLKRIRKTLLVSK
jgi:hypothetical protein